SAKLVTTFWPASPPGRSTTDSPAVPIASGLTRRGFSEVPFPRIVLASVVLMKTSGSGTPALRRTVSVMISPSSIVGDRGGSYLIRSRLVAGSSLPPTEVSPAVSRVSSVGSAELARGRCARRQAQPEPSACSSTGGGGGGQ